MNKRTSRNVVSFRSSRHKKHLPTHSQIIHKRRIIAICSVILIVVVFFGYQIIHAKLSETQIRNSIVVDKKKLGKEKQKNADLKIKEKQLKDDDYIQKIIRAKYYYSKNNEQIYAIPGSDDFDYDK